MSEGFVYVAINPSIPGLVKIGRTERVPSARMKELQSTGVPEPFEVAYYALVENAKHVERCAHDQLVRYRKQSNREFFAVSVHAAVRVIRDIEKPKHESESHEILSQLVDSTGSEHMIELISRHNIESEESELSEFAKAIHSENLHPFVVSAFYDSNSCCCSFELAKEVEEYSSLESAIKAVALSTISQFEWHGCIEHGPNIAES